MRSVSVFAAFLVCTLRPVVWEGGGSNPASYPTTIRPSGLCSGCEKAALIFCVSAADLTATWDARTAASCES
jgi:hypothetical protein